jgi:cob(I)alamin adenosyltransferase
MTARPRILIFTGDGKGKTTAALGMAFRAAGHGQAVCFIQFIKADDSVGELAAAQQTGLFRIVQTGRGFVPDTTSPAWPDHRAAAQAGISAAAEAISGDGYAMVVLDEVCGAVAKRLIDLEQIVELISRARPATCLVLTGRDAPRDLVALADTVTEMLPIKHAFEDGRPAEKGVEW